MRAGLERQVRHEGGEARRARVQAMGKSKSAMFHENKKRWLSKVLGKATRHMSTAHCGEAGVDGIRVLQTSPTKVKASLDKHFYNWTKHTTDRNDAVLEGYEELVDTYQEFKEEALWHKDLSMHVKRARSLHMSQVMKNTGEMEWSVMGHRLKGNDTVEDWCHEEGGEVRVKEFGDMVNEGRLTGKAPPQVYCLVRHMLTGGAGGEGEIKSGEVDPSFMGSAVEEGMHLERVRDSIEPALETDDEIRLRGCGGWHRWWED